MKNFLLLLINFFCFVRANEDKFIKKYALMKMYESCFGPDVIREVRKEMKIATAKCSGVPPSVTLYTPSGSPIKTSLPSFQHASRQPSPDPSYSIELLKSQLSSNFDLNKLQQAIYNGFSKQQQHNGASSLQNLVGPSNYRPWTNFPADSGLGPGGYHQPYSPVVQSMNPFYPSVYLWPYYRNVRTTRDLDINNQMESFRGSGKAKNVTCVMRELGYIGKNMDPDYDKIVERIKKLSITDDLKEQMAQGVEYCRQFSLCVPEEKNYKLTKDMMKPLFFFRCYKHKKMEACVMKDIKERYAEENNIEHNTVGSDRTVRSNDDSFYNNETLEIALHEFLYGEDSTDVDLML